MQSPDITDVPDRGPPDREALDLALRKFQNELSAGTVSLALLAVLGRRPSRCTATRSPSPWSAAGEGVLSGKQSALYPVLRNLEGAGLAGQPRRALGRRPAAPLLPHHRHGPRRAVRMGRRLARDPRFRRFRPRRTPAMNASAPAAATIPEYLDQLRAALAGADPALVQDALYDAEEYLRSELAENPGKREAEVHRLGRRQLRRAGGSRRHLPRHRSHGADRAARAAAAAARVAAGPLLRRRRRSAHLRRAVLHAARARHRHLLLHLGRHRRVAVGGPGGADHRHPVRDPVPRLGARAVAGRRPHRRGDARRTHAAPAAVQPRAASRWLERIKDMFIDPRTWSTLLYMLAMLPLGIVYFTLDRDGCCPSLSLHRSPPVLLGFGACDRWCRSTAGNVQHVAARRGSCRSCSSSA